MKAGLPLSDKFLLKKDKITTIAVVSLYGVLVVVNKTVTGLSMIDSRD
jgi:ABC-type proline/glycine betaine transport system permease subunit